MSEYRITYTEIPAQRTDYDEDGDQTEPQHSGLLIHIRPPVQLNPDAVQRYLEWSTLRPIDCDGDSEVLEVKDVVLLGSTEEQTTIYASIERGFQGFVDSEEKVQSIIQDTLEDTGKLLRFMGARATIDTVQTPEADN